MNKCKKCGNEFEGRFCPECGEKVESIVVFEVGETTQTATEPLQTVSPSQNLKEQFKFVYLTKLSKKVLSCLLLSIIFICGATVTLIAKNSRGMFITTSSSDGEFDVSMLDYIITAVVMGIIFIILIACCIMMLTNKRALLDYPELLKLRQMLKMYLRAAVVVCILIALVVGYAYLHNKVSEAPYVLILAVPLLIGYFAMLIVGLKFIKKIEKQYITKSPDGTIVNTFTPLVTASIEQFKNLNDMRERKCNEQRKAMGKAPKSAREIELIYLYKKITVTLGAVIVASVIFVSVIFAVTLFSRNIFDINRMEKISVGDNIGYVARILGDPYDKREIKDNNDNVISGTYVYCSSSLAEQITRINKKLEKFEDAEDFGDLEEMFRLSDQLVTLQEQLARTKCDYVTVQFKNDKVDYVSLIKNCYYGTEIVGEVSEITYASDEFGNYYNYGKTVEVGGAKNKINLNVRMYFADGSFLNKQISVEINPAVSGTQNINWSDAFGIHELQLKVK